MNRRLLVRGILRRHVAVQYALFDPRTYKMFIARAGMAGPIDVSGEECRILELSGIPPGLFSVASYDGITIQLKPGDSVFFFTDGLTDASDARREQFGIEGLPLLCLENRCAPPREMLEQVFGAVDCFSAGCEQQDDMAATFFHYSE
jgi:sigma-B regulation protein RsbU (phosphoserine phosphatase)